ncbi:MAG: hypothetical protein ABJB33_07120 [Gemmatimonadota bacterium]
MSQVTRRSLALLGALFALHASSAASQEVKPAGWEWGVHGTLLMNGFYNDNEVNTSDLPTTASPALPAGSLPQHSLGAEIRQTRIVGTGDLPGFAGGALHTELDVDFFGAQTGGARSGPALRVRRLFGEVHWDRWSLLMGQEGPLAADVNPTSLATLGVPGYAAAGNLWLWIPQIRAGVDLNGGDGVIFGMDVAALASTTPEGQSTGLAAPNSGERSGRPMFEGRLRARWGGGAEIGIGGHTGWFATTGDSLLTSNAVIVSGIIPLGGALELRGEWFTGQALGPLGGGGIGQNFDSNGEPLQTSGGWGQLNLKAGARWEFGAGYGYDDPRGTATDQANVAFRDKNTQYGGRAQWRMAPAVIALEYRHLATEWGGAVGLRTATHLNLAFGVDF